MLKHNLLIIFRNYKRYKSTFFINLLGLSVGLACAVLIYLWVNDELHMDKFNKNDARLFQVMENAQLSDRIVTRECTPDLLTETMASELPEIEYAAAVTPSSWFSFILSKENENIKATGQFAGKDFFNVFSFGLIEGDPSTALDNLNSIVLSDELAKKMFSSESNAIGKTIEWNLIGYVYQATVTGVCKAPPSNSTMKFEFVLPFQAWLDISKKINSNLNWDNHALNAYLVLKAGTDIKSFNKKIAGYLKAKLPSSNVALFAKPFSDGYLYNKYENGIQAGGRIEYVKLFLILAGFIIFIACINFMNLSTAKAAGRMKEIGIKKTAGADRRSLVFQYLGESLIMTAISTIVSLIIVTVFLPQFNDITGKQINLEFNSGLMILLAGITVVTGLVSGLYPALYISGMKPAAVLKGKLKRTAGELWARRGLVAFQFTLSVMLIVGVLVVFLQLRFIQTKNPGIDKNNVIYFGKEGSIVANQETFLTELRKVSGVENASSCNSNFIGSFNATAGVSWSGKNPDDDYEFETKFVDYDLIETLGINIKEGRSFSKDFGTEDNNLIINETAVRLMGLKNPVGKTIRLWGINRQIIGVARDFNFESFHKPVKPLLFNLDPDKTLQILVKIDPARTAEVLDRIGLLYEKFNPGYTFSYKFMDTDYQAQYEAESRVASLSRYFAGMAIIISCLGLFGLTTFSAERRRKEIGVRKVLGASVPGIIKLLSKEFIVLVLTANILALPVAYYFANQWLQSFAYRMDLNWWIFLLAGGTALLIALITVSFQAVRAAVSNPVESLRYE